MNRRYEHQYFIDYWTGNEVENVCQEWRRLLKFYSKWDSSFMEIGGSSTNLLFVNRHPKKKQRIECVSSVDNVKMWWRSCRHRRRRRRRQLINPEINLFSSLNNRFCIHFDSVSQSVSQSMQPYTMQQIKEKSMRNLSVSRLRNRLWFATFVFSKCQMLNEKRKSIARRSEH